MGWETSAVCPPDRRLVRLAVDQAEPFKIFELQDMLIAHAGQLANDNLLPVRSNALSVQLYGCAHTACFIGDPLQLFLLISYVSRFFMLCVAELQNAFACTLSLAPCSCDVLFEPTGVCCGSVPFVDAPLTRGTPIQEHQSEGEQGWLGSSNRCWRALQDLVLCGHEPRELAP